MTQVTLSKEQYDKLRKVVHNLNYFSSLIPHGIKGIAWETKSIDDPPAYVEMDTELEKHLLEYIKEHIQENIEKNVADLQELAVDPLPQLVKSKEKSND